MAIGDLTSNKLHIFYQSMVLNSKQIRCQILREIGEPYCYDCKRLSNNLRKRRTPDGDPQNEDKVNYRFVSQTDLADR